MIRSAVRIAAMLGLLVGPSAWANPPKITGVAPAGVRRGESTEVTITGTGLAGNPRLIAPFTSRSDEVKGSNATSWKIKLTVDSGAAVGTYPIRVQTDDGISNPFLLAVGQLPQVVEREDNSTFEQAQSIPDPPLVVEGQAAGNDVDFFRFRGRKGQRIILDAQCARIGSGIDPTIRLTTASARRTYVASADDTPGLLTDARLAAVLPEDGDYVVEISDTRYQGAGRPVYRLVIGDVPVAEEIYPLGGRAGETLGIELRGGTMNGVRIAAATVHSAFGSDLFRPRITGGMVGETASPARDLDFESMPPLVVSTYPELREPADPAAAPVKAVAPVVFNGRIEAPGDEDRFALAVTPGSRVRIKVNAYELGSTLDPVLRVEGPGGKAIANADDTTIPLPPKGGMPQSIILPDPTIETTVPSGTTELIVVIRDLQQRGGVGFPYRIVAEPLGPDFELAANDSEVSVPKGGTATVGGTIKRKGYSGPIELGVDNPPAALSVRPGTIPAGQAAGVLTLSASADAHFDVTTLKLMGRGDGPLGRIERVSERPVVFAMQSNLPTSSMTEYGLVVAPAGPTPVVIETPAGPIEVAHGFGATVPVKVVRSRGAEGTLAFAAPILPAGITVPGDKAEGKAETVNVRIQAAVEAPLGAMTLGLHAKGKIAGADRTIDAPGVSLVVVRPAALELSAPAIEIKAGATVEVKGRVVRKGTFNEPVTVRVNGLPAGLKADPVTVAPGASSFAVKIVADAKAKPTSAGAQVAMAFQVNKKDYAVPPTPLSVKVAAAK